MSTQKTFAVEIKEASWYGVDLPRWIRVFDCRCAKGTEFSAKAPWGATLMGSERAEVDMGLRGETWDERHATTPMSCSTYIDARTCDESELRKQVSDMVREAARMRDTYLKAKENPAKEGEGGGCNYMPVGIALSNFGWSIIADTRTCVVSR